jgi:hypothetical protein
VSDVFGVGSKEEEPFTSVRCTDGGCAYTRPLRIEPEAGKISEDSCKLPSNNDPWDILSEQVSGS